MLHITGVRKIGRRCLLMSVTGLAWEQAPHRPSSRSPRLCSAKLLFSTAVTGQARISAYSFNNHLGTPSGPAAFLGLNLYKVEKRWAPKGLAVRNPHCVTGGMDSGLWKDSIGCSNAELIWLEISLRSDRRVEPSICKLANKESEPEARAMPAICFRWFDFEA